MGPMARRTEGTRTWVTPPGRSSHRSTTTVRAPAALRPRHAEEQGSRSDVRRAVGDGGDGAGEIPADILLAEAGHQFGERASERRPVSVHGNGPRREGPGPHRF